MVRLCCGRQTTRRRVQRWRRQRRLWRSWCWPAGTLQSCSPAPQTFSVHRYTSLLAVRIASEHSYLLHGVFISTRMRCCSAQILSTAQASGPTSFFIYEVGVLTCHVLLCNALTAICVSVSAQDACSSKHADSPRAFLGIGHDSQWSHLG